MFAAIAVAIGSPATARPFQAHYIAVLCTVGPCPDWQVVDVETGETFYAVADFARIPKPPALTNDLLIEGQRLKLPRPSGDGIYERLVVTAILKATPAVPGYRP